MPTTESNIIRSIVLIDDDADFHHVMRRRLKELRAEYAPTNPVEIHAFTDPVEALVNLPADGICVIFLDYNLPGSTGLDWMPKLSRAALGPVILLTNNNDAKVAAEAFRTGASDFIAKSELVSDPQRLGRAIREGVHRYRLESRNASLTRQLKLVNIELASKNERLQTLTKTAHQFVDDVAHDFRTPLTVIQQYASIIADGLSGPTTDRQREFLTTIAEATGELSEMVDDFLDSSKLRARALSVDRQQHSVQELFASVAPMLDVRTASKKIPIERVISQDVPPFFGDLSKVTRILSNLAVNAIKVTPDTRPLRLSADRTEDGDVRVGVTDQGPGLRPQDLSIIFDRFQQLNETHPSGAKGFGLGLSIVKQLSRLNLGRVEVQSEPGKGSTFSFTLPGFDLRRVVTNYLQNSRDIHEDQDLWVLRIHPRNGSPEPSMLRRLVSSFCYPMDVVLQDSETASVNALGCSRDPNAWAARIREAVVNFGQTRAAPEAYDIEVKVEGPWLRETDDQTLVEGLCECLGTGSCHV